MGAPNKPQWAGTIALTETSKSGKLQGADRIILTKVYEGPYVVCWNSALPRGTFGTGLLSGWVCTGSTVENDKGAHGTLTITWEPGGLAATMPLPCQDFSIEPIELYPRIERHPMFTGLSALWGAAIDLQHLTLAYTAMHGATPQAKAGAYQQLTTDLAKPDPLGHQGALGVLLVDKLQKGEETFYLAGQKYTWTSYSYAAPRASLGGFIQAPYGPGAIPLTALDPTLGWLRLADSLAPAGVNGSMFKLVRTWIGGPGGYWDPDLYPTP